MAKFPVTFVRLVVQRERVTREIEAADMAEALTLAGEMADEFDRSCPDDVEEFGGEECDAWEPRVTPAATEIDA